MLNFFSISKTGIRHCMRPNGLMEMPKQFGMTGHDDIKQTKRAKA
jgi:hypothetical protein